MKLVIQNVSGQRLPGKTSAILNKIFNKFFSKKLKEITVRFVSDRQMIELNGQFKNKKYSTDVLAFDSGDIAVCIDAAKRQCRELKHSLRRELLHLAVHGLLHIEGMSDDTEKKRELMNIKTEKLLDARAYR